MVKEKKTFFTKVGLSFLPFLVCFQTSRIIGMRRVKISNILKVQILSKLSSVIQSSFKKAIFHY